MENTRVVELTVDGELLSYSPDELIELMKLGLKYSLVEFDTNFGTKVKVARCKEKALIEMMKVFLKMPGLKKVYLFGSCITTECRNKSDIDFYVIVDDIEDRHAKYERSELISDDIMLILREYNWFENTEERFDKRVKQGFKFENEVNDKGVLLYERI